TINHMKTLVIVRHAKSSWDVGGLSDHERPLSDRGLRDAPVMGARLADWGPPVDRVISSSAVRAFTTAELVTQQMGLPWDEIQIEDALYHASEEDMIEIIQEQDDYLDGLMLFGHNPGMTYLVNDLSDLDLDNLPTCGVAVMQFDVDSWSDIGDAVAVTAAVDFPKKKL
ncbi:MAG: histidine phosphatase family protein, partial [Anaerolineales bacterium]|nr:histidine phosphatase family protein [Anaerolineales bacterium]